MTALQWILKEAKKLKKQYPKRFTKWTEYVAQASAIYSSKHKGKSPVGKKRKKVSGVKDSAKVRSELKKKGLKMPHGYETIKRKRKIGSVKKKKISEQSILNKIHKVKEDVSALDELQHKHMIGTLSKHTIDKIKDELHNVKKLETHLSILRNIKPKIVKSQLPVIKREIKNTIDALKEHKTHITQLKKHI